MYRAVFCIDQAWSHLIPQATLPMTIFIDIFEQRHQPSFFDERSNEASYFRIVLNYEFQHFIQEIIQKRSACIPVQ